MAKHVKVLVRTKIPNSITFITHLFGRYWLFNSEDCEKIVFSVLNIDINIWELKGSITFTNPYFCRSKRILSMFKQIVSEKRCYMKISIEYYA